MDSSFWWIIIVFSLLAFLFLLLGIRALRGRQFFRLSISWALALLFFALAALATTVAMATQGYRAFSREEKAARVRIEPLENQWFRAEFYLSDGRVSSFRLAGDELYVDAHILKWKPIANFFGLHTAYELDRVAGRYHQLIDEQTKPRTVFSLSQEKPLNIFDLRKRYFFLRPLLDAEYGSATFIAAGKRVELDILVSISGLLIRTAKEN
jgi:hypothetical protein